MNRRVVLAYFIVELLFYAVALQNNTDEESSSKLFSNYTDLAHCQNAESGFGQRKWISQLFHEARMEFQMNPNVNSECKKDFELYTLHLKNQSMWAVKMMESSEWPLHGILSGTNFYLGNYEECLAISSYGIDGRYCLAEVTYDYSDLLQSELVDAPNETISAWDAVTMYEKNPTRINRKKLTFAMCIPSSCKPNDLKISLDSTLSPIFRPHRVNLSIDVKPILCRARNEFVYPTGFYVVSSFFIAFFSLVIWCTWYDIVNSTALAVVEMKREQENHLFEDISETFSIVRNFRNLVTISAKQSAALHFPKVVNMLVILFMHRFLFTFFFAPVSNSITIERAFRSSMSIFLTRTACVDVFLFVSGFLMFRMELGPMIKGGKVFLFSSIMMKWLRLIPVNGVLILFITYILPYIGDGPIWNRNMLAEAGYCKENWWTNLLAINNIVNSDRQCIVTGWTIAVELQLGIIGGILLYIYTKHEKMGIFATAFVFSASFVLTFYICYVNQLSGIWKITRESSVNPRLNRDVIHLYMTSYLRCGPYLLGFIGAYLVKLLKERNFKLTNKQIYVLMLVFTLLSEAPQIYGTAFYTFNRPYDRFENALFSATNRIIFVSFYIVFFCAYFTSGLGIFNKIVECKIWIPLGRLLYSIYAVGPIVQLYHLAYQREPFSIGQFNAVWLFLGDFVICFVLAFIFHLLIEAPIVNLKALVHAQIMRLQGNSKQAVEEVNNKENSTEIECKKNT